MGANNLNEKNLILSRSPDSLTIRHLGRDVAIHILPRKDWKNPEITRLKQDIGVDDRPQYMGFTTPEI